MRSFSPSPVRARVVLGASLILSLFAAGIAGCASDATSRAERRRLENPQTPLAGSTAFFDGALTVEARLGPFHARRPRPDGDEAELDGRGERVRRRNGGGGGGSGFSGSVGGPGGGMSMGDGGPPPSGGEFEGGRPPRRDYGGDAHFGGPPEGGRGGMLGFPRQTLRLTLTNRGLQTLKFELAELRSALGNFAPRPERLELAPGAAAELDPVSGDAGGALDSLEVAFSIRRAEETSTQVIRLIPTGEPAPRPPARE